MLLIWGYEMRCLSCLAMGLLIAFGPSGTMGQTRPGHDALHYWYKTLKSPEGESCCNDKDCHPVEGRFVKTGDVGPWVLEIRIGNRWVTIPRDRILPQPCLDGAVHACYTDRTPYMATPGLTIRCVMIGSVS
jgi:hypothetical protein